MNASWLCSPGKPLDSWAKKPMVGLQFSLSPGSGHPVIQSLTYLAGV